MSMFGSLSHKIAHASTIPSLGNQDLRALQDLISREKEVVTSIQRLSGDLVRATEALKAWGQGEGLDLGDTLAQSGGALSHVVAALNGFAGHEQNIRARMKEIRTREENLDDLRKRRKNVMAKAEAAEKRLNRMGSENKNLVQQTNLLAQLTDEMRQLDTEILSEEAKVGDFKRRVTKQFMLLKFGGLLEFAEKATIVGELGKLIINEIPLDATAPGQPRVPYHGYEKTVQLASEITRCINEVRFVADPDHSALTALKGNSNDNASEMSELVPPPPLSTVVEPEFAQEIAKPPSPSSPRKLTFGGVFSSLGRTSSSSPERRRDPPLSLPVSSREPYQADSRRVSSVGPPNLFLPEIGGPSLSASLGMTSPPNEGQQSIQGLPVSPTSNTTANNNNSTMDRTFMNLPSEFGGRPALVTENRTVSSSAAPPALVSKPYYNTLPLSRPSEEKPVVPSVTGAPPPSAPAPPPPLMAKPPAPLTQVQQGPSQGSIARIIDPPGTKVAAGRFAAFPLKSRRTINLQPENNPSTDAPPQSRPTVVVPTAADTPNNGPAKSRDAPSKSESPRPSTDGGEPQLASENIQPHIRRNDSARVRFAATPPITPATIVYTEDSDDAPDDELDVPQMDDRATEGINNEQGWRLDNKGRSANGPNNGNSVAPLRKKPSFEPPEPIREIGDMSEAELNAMIDAMAAQVGSPSSSFSPASQFSPASGSPPSTLATPSTSRIGSVTNANRPLASSSPIGGDPSLSGSGRINAAAFKRPALKMPGLPPYPKFGGGDTTSKASMAPGVQSQAVPSPEPRRSTEEAEQASSQHAVTPPVQHIHADQTPMAPTPPAEHPSRERTPPPSVPTPPEIAANTLDTTPSFPLPVPPAPQTTEMDFEIIPTPEYERDQLSLRPKFTPLDTSMVSPLGSSQAINSPGNHGSVVSPGGDKSVNTPLPPGAGPPRRPGQNILPDSLLPGGRRDSPAPSQSPERGPGSGSFNNVPAQQDLTGVGSLAHTKKDGSRRASNGPPSVGPPSLMPLDPSSPMLNIDFGGVKGYRSTGLPQRAPSNAGYGAGKFMTNLEDVYEQEKEERGSGSWR